MKLKRKYLQAPFPWFGGKSRVASTVWKFFGHVDHYLEPFYGSGAVHILRPDFNPLKPSAETVNDKDGLICNFWRSIKNDPTTVAKFADWPINENDLHARHSYLTNIKPELVPRIEGDPQFFDAKIAGWWVWAVCCWIGRSFTTGDGPWIVKDGKLIKGEPSSGLKRERPVFGGRGVCRQNVNMEARGVNRQIPFIAHHRGVQCQLRLQDWFDTLSLRLRWTVVCCGDWKRIIKSDKMITRPGIAGIFLDPPYSMEAGRDNNLYSEEDLQVAGEAREWAIEHGENKKMRIALCGYSGEHKMPKGWRCVKWKSPGGFGSLSKKHDNPNAKRERIWFSPYCSNEHEGLFSQETQK
jgi:site-specific DNA-adenine methylase